jgi:signal transduction histidine kinase/integral membrane sensor domain MASE1
MAAWAAAGPNLRAPFTAAVAYFLAAKLGELLAFPDAPVSALWAPNAILLAALLLAPRERWWQYFAAILPFHFLAQLPTSPLSQVAIQYAMNCAEALLGALPLVVLLREPQRFDRVRSAMFLILFAGILAPLVTSAAMAAAFVAAGLGNDFWLTTIARTITNTFAIVALVPLIVHTVARVRQKPRAISLRGAAEAGLLGVCLIALGVFVFARSDPGQSQSPALMYAPLPLLLWATVRFGTLGACGSTLLLAAVSTWGVLRGYGPFTAQLPVQNALSLVMFQVATTAPLLVLAALLEERKLIARALSTSDARFRGIFANNIIPTAIWQRGRGIREANDAFLQLTGFTRAELEAGLASCPELTTDISADDHSALVPCERQLRLRDGREVPVFTGGYPFPDEPDLGVLYAFDLSEVRRAEAARERLQALHTAVLASLHDHVAVLERDGRIVETNESWRRFVAVSAHRRLDRVVAGDNFLDACREAAAQGDPVAEALLAGTLAVLSGSLARRQFVFAVSTAADRRWFELTIETLRRADGGAVLTRTDVTAEKTAQIEASEQRGQLAHLNRAAALGELSGAFAHELNQPLAAILGNAEVGLRLLQRNPPDLREIHVILEEIAQEDERAAEIIHRLAGLMHGGTRRRQAVTLQRLVLEVVDLTHSDLACRHVTLTMDLDASAPTVLADRVQLQQVILNLIMNACDAMSDVATQNRKLTIATRVLQDKGEVVEVSISDRGCGIAPADEERIFAPFFTTKEHGLGLGLTICRSIVDAHGGRLWARNVASGGAIFRFTIPRGEPK